MHEAHIHTYIHTYITYICCWYLCELKHNCMATSPHYWPSFVTHVYTHWLPYPPPPKHTHIYQYSRILFTVCFFGITYGLTKCAIFFGYVVTFRFGAYQLTLPVDDIAYARFERIYTVFIALIFSSLALGQAGSNESGFAQAKRSARRLFAIIDRRPAIDNYSEDGLKPVRN